MLKEKVDIHIKYFDYPHLGDVEVVGLLLEHDVTGFAETRQNEATLATQISDHHYFLQGVMPLSTRYPLLVSVAIQHPRTPSTIVMEWFREGSMLSGAFREHGGVEVMACVIRTAA